MHEWAGFHCDDGFWSRWAVAQCTVSSLGVVVYQPLLDQDLSLTGAVEDVTIEQFIPHTDKSARSYRPPSVLRLDDQSVACAAWNGVVSERGKPDAPRYSAQHEYDQCKHGNERGSEVSLCSLSQNQFVERQIRNSPAQPFVFFCSRFSSFN